MTITIRTILSELKTQMFSFDFIGNESDVIIGFCSISRPKNKCISWIKHTEPSDIKTFKGINSMLIVVPEKCDVPIKNCNFIITDSPKSVFFTILNAFFINSTPPSVSANSIIESTSIGNNVSIGHHCYIGPDVIIEDNTIIEHNVTIISPVKIGSRCLIHSGVVIGSDGFGFFTNEDGQPCKVPHFGGIEIGNDVEIGANTCIDRGTIDNTIISDNVKIDNLCHISHNVIIEKNAMVVAGAVICGSARLKERSYIAPGGIVKNQLCIGENSFVGIGAVVTKNVEDGSVVVGVPAEFLRQIDITDK